MEGKRKQSGSDQDYSMLHKMPPLHKSSHNSPHHEDHHKQCSPTNWDLYYDQLSYEQNGTSVFRAGNQGALYFCIHGAGHSALSFALLAHQIKNFGTLVAYDIKGHGYSKYTENLKDYSIETLCKEAIQILKIQMKKFPKKNIVIIGHSLGGSIATRITDFLTNSQHDPRILGLVVIDVVQGTAIESLPFMAQVLQSKPKSFEHVQGAIKWSITSGTLKKVQAARISIPPQLKEVEKDGVKKYVWKNNLRQTQEFWLDWFKGLSSLFLKIKIAKILLTAERERLDKQLTIAQMQGKFKLEILHNVGHSIQQDNCKDTAKTIYKFMRDFRIPMDQEEVHQKQFVGIANFHPNLKPY